MFSAVNSAYNDTKQTPSMCTFENKSNNALLSCICLIRARSITFITPILVWQLLGGKQRLHLRSWCGHQTKTTGFSKNLFMSCIGLVVCMREHLVMVQKKLGAPAENWNGRTLGKGKKGSGCNDLTRRLCCACRQLFSWLARSPKEKKSDYMLALLEFVYFRFWFNCLIWFSLS